MTRDEIHASIRRLYARLERIKRGSPEALEIVRQIRELSDKLKG
jgi:hypothetical protein